MPPRRASTKPPLPSTAKPARQSKLAKEHHISAATEADISAAFELFVLPSKSASESSISTAAIPNALTALGAPPTSATAQHDLLAAADPTGTGTVTYATFVGLAALQLQSKGKKKSKSRLGRDRGNYNDDDEKNDPDDDDDDGDNDNDNDEVEHAFNLFTGGSGEQRITLAMLRRVARELKEDVDEQVLKDMIREARGGDFETAGEASRNGVSLREFEGVMRRAGVFR